jgi:sugar lactone lactonase YvrE
MRYLWVLCMCTVITLSCKKQDLKQKPEIPSSSLELLFSDSTYQLTGIAVSREGRLFTNYPLWSGTYKYALVEIHPDGHITPYPDSLMNSWKPGENGVNKWVCIQSVHIDDANNMWVVDPASPMLAGVYQNSHKLARINLTTNKTETIYRFSETAGENSYLNDVRVDTARQYAYLTNSSEGGIVVLNLATGISRQVLQGDSSVKSDMHYSFKIDSKIVERSGTPVKIHSDGLALTPDGMYLYYKPLSDNKLYRIKTEFLRNDSIISQQMSSHVEYLGEFTTTDGMVFDKKGNLYLGDLENYRIIQIAPNLKMRVLIEDERLSWPDSYQVSDDGYLYISCSQIHKQPEFNKGENKRTSPFALYRVKLPE